MLYSALSIASAILDFLIKLLKSFRDIYNVGTFLQDSGERGIRTPGTKLVRQFSKLLVSATHPPLLIPGINIQSIVLLFLAVG
jgi:hypothetical protein